ncbi:hypothetical protein T484DRAFT_1763544 [Baffinella frigidus]|nr:hypothetical protein T484DRAFT_1763544 [Cryptophyta sp. CCMP2293]
MGGLARSRAGALVHTVALALALLVGSGVGEHLFSLASEGAHALFGGHGNGNDDLSDAAAAHGIPGLTPGNSPDEQFERRPFLFGLSSSPSRYPLEFLTSAYAQGARRVALVTNVGYPITMAVCAAARARAEALGMLVVYEGRYSTADGTPFECQTLVAGMVRARPDTLVGCTLEPDAMGLAHALVNSGVLLGAMPPSSGWTGAVPARVTSRVLRYHQPSRKDQID